MKQVSDLTGGGFFTATFNRRKTTLGMDGVDANKNPLSLAFRSQLAGVIEELRHQYTLGFVPTKRDGKMAAIDVRVSRSKADVWARKTYIAPKE